VTDLWHPVVIRLMFKIGHVRGYLFLKTEAVFWVCWNCTNPTYSFPKDRETMSFGI